MAGEYVTQSECDGRRKEVMDIVNQNSKDIVDLKIIITELKVDMRTTNSMLKAIFGVVAPGIVGIIVILLTRGL